MNVWVRGEQDFRPRFFRGYILALAKACRRHFSVYVHGADGGVKKFAKASESCLRRRASDPLLGSSERTMMAWSEEVPPCPEVPRNFLLHTG